MDNNSERKRLCRIERKRKKAALRVTLLKRILVTAVCAAIITGMGRDLIPAMAEETTAAPTGSVPAVSASGSTDTGNNSGAVGSTGSGSSDSSDSAVTSGTGGTGSTGSTDTGTGTDTDKTETTATAATDENPLLLNAMLLGAGNPNSVEEGVEVDSCSFYDKNGVKLDPTGTYTVNSGDNFKIRYDLKTMYLNNPSSDGTYVQPCKEYPLPALPDVFALYNTSSPLDLKDGGTTYGHVTIKTEDNKLVPYVFINDDTGKDYISNAYFELGLQFTDSIKNGTGETVTVDLGTLAGSFTFDLSDKKKEKPSLKKEVQVDPNDKDRLLWTVTMTNAANSVDIPDTLNFVDTMDSKLQYVPDTFAYQIGNAASVKATPVISGNVLTYAFTGTQESKANNAVVKFTYDTVFTDLAKSGFSGSLTADNTVQIKDSSDQPFTDEAKSSYTVTGNAPKEIKKEFCELVGSGDTGYAKWKITITNGSSALKDVYVYDKTDANGSESSMALCTDDNAHPISVSGTSTAYTVDTNAAVNNAGGTDDGNAYDWSYRLDTVAANETVTITYWTKVSNFEALSKSTKAGPTNKAWLKYTESVYGIGDKTGNIGPSGPVGIGKTSYVIQKTCTGYDATAHQFTWNVVVNPYSQLLTGVKVEDIIPDGQEYVSDTSGLGTDKITVNSTDKKVSFDFGDIDSKKTFNIVTRLTDGEMQKFNNGSISCEKTYRNVVNLYDGAATPPAGTDSADGKAGGSAVVKNCTGKDEGSHTISWKLVINAGKMPMKNITAEDTLQTGLSLVDDSVKYNNVSVPVGSGTGNYVTKVGQKIIFHAADTSDQLEIEYKTSYDPDTVFASAVNKGTVTVQNQAVLHNSDTDTTGIKSNIVTTELHNNVLSKSLTDENPSSQELRFRVGINAPGKKLPADYLITDIMSEGLAVTGTKLQKISAGTDGNYAYDNGTDVAQTGYTVKTSIASDGRTVLSLTIKNPGSSVYALIYTVDASGRKSNEIKNDVYIGSSASGNGNTDTVDRTLQSSQWGEAGAESGNYYYIKVVKRDADTGKAVTGSKARFGLEDSGGNIVYYADTDGNGVAYFHFLKSTTDYKIVELSAPAGYEISNVRQSIVMPSASGKAKAKENDFADKKQPNPPAPAPHNPSTPSSSESSSTTSVSTTTRSKTTSKTTSVTTSSATSTTTSKPPEYFDIHHNPVNPDTFKGEVLGADGRKVRGARRGYDVLGNRRAGTSTGDDSPVWPIAVLIISAAGMVLINRFRHYLRNKR
jgi:uncharacterized repeat protein (TIGR01451 family)